MKLYAVSYGFGLYVVRAEDEDHACRVAYDGPNLGEHDGWTAGETDNDGFDREGFDVRELAAAGPAGILSSHFG